MVALYAGLDLDFPLGPKSRRAELHEAMRRMDRAGKSYNEIAREAGVNRRTAIRQIKGVTERDKSQPDMFADHHPRPRNATKAR